MEKYIDLTFKSCIKEDEMRELLNKPGFYRIPVKTYYNVFNNGPVFKEVEVVYVTPKNARMLVIIVKIDEDTYQDFYYNGNECLFKILTFNDFCEEEIEFNTVVIYLLVHHLTRTPLRIGYPVIIPFPIPVLVITKSEPTYLYGVRHIEILGSEHTQVILHTCDILAGL